VANQKLKKNENRGVKMKQMPSYYAVIPPKVRYDRNLSPNAKLLWCELSALQTFCRTVYASNDYLCKLLNLKQRQIQYLLKELKEAKYIEIEYDNDQRVIVVNDSLTKATPKRKKRKKGDKDPQWLKDYIEHFEDGVEDL
jgi:Cdc6-like AAA superfamily ATPase